MFCIYTLFEVRVCCIVFFKCKKPTQYRPVINNVHVFMFEFHLRCSKNSPLKAAIIIHVLNVYSIS